MTDALGFFAQSCAAFDVAVQTAGATEHRLCIAGRQVCIRIAGDGMAAFLPALAHLQADGDPAHTAHSLTICLWDSQSTGTPMPKPPWGEAHYRLRGEIAEFNNERVRTVFDLGRGMFYMIDLQCGRALAWTRDASQVPAYEIAAPMLPIWNAWLGHHGDMLLHAAAVGRPEGGVLLAGKSGSGKSTTALACLHSPLSYLADDACIVTGGDAPRIHSLFCTGRVLRDNLHRVPHMQVAFDRISPDEDKVICLLTRHFASRLLRDCPLHAILVPVITHEKDTRIQPAPAAAVMRALAPSTLFHLGAVAGPQDAQRMAGLARRVPGYHLRLGSRMSDVPAALGRFIQGIAPQPV
jgi:hypothetical protein